MNATLTDLDSNMLSFLLLNLSGIRDTGEEKLIFSTADFNLIETDNKLDYISYQIRRNSSLEFYLDIIRNLRYQNTINEPTLGPRMVYFQVASVNDGIANLFSNEANSTIILININDNPPVFSQINYTGNKSSRSFAF